MNRSQVNSTLKDRFKLCTITIKYDIQMLHNFSTHLFAFFSWQLLLCVHRHEKELQNTQKINMSTEFKTLSQAAPISASVKQLRARAQTWDHTPCPQWPPHSHWSKRSKTASWSALCTLQWHLTKQQVSIFIHHGIQSKRELISSV